MHGGNGFGWWVDEVVGRGRQALQGALPGLRVVGLTYTALGGVLALGLVAGVALMPLPAVQQATGPARQAVTSLIQPTGDAIGGLIGAPPPVVELPRPAPALNVEPGPGLDLSAGEEGAAEETVVEPEPTQVIAVATPPTFVAQQAVAAVEDVAPVETPAEEPELAPEVAEPTPEPQVVVVSEPVLQSATQSCKPLPPPPPTTPLEVRAREDAANQAAIDAIKAAQVRAKAEADAANQAAIDARKTADVVASLSAPPMLIAQQPTQPVAGLTGKAAADAANQAMIDSAKSAQARAKAQADAANQAAIDAARAARAGIKLPTPTAVPTQVPAPQPQPTPAPAVEAAPAEEAQPAESDDVDVEDEAPAPAVDEAPAPTVNDEAPAVDEAPSKQAVSRESD